jgi:hypothetical protein
MSQAAFILRGATMATATLDDVNTALDQILSIIDPDHYTFDYRVNAKRTVYTVKKNGVFVAQIDVEPDQNGLPVVKPVTRTSNDPELFGEWLRYAAEVIMPRINQLGNGAQPAEPSADKVSNISGGVNVDAHSVTVGNDVVGRDKIIHIKHATIIQPLPHET